MQTKFSANYVENLDTQQLFATIGIVSSSLHSPLKHIFIISHNPPTMVVSKSSWVMVSLYLYKNIGSTILKNSHSTSPIFLKYVLHIPTLSQRLISIDKLCHDNQAFVEFYPTYFLCEGPFAPRWFFFGGNLDRSLYKLSPTDAKSFFAPSIIAPAAFLNRLEDTSIWYYRLGHPTLSIVKQVLNTCNLQAKSSSPHFFCKACQMAKIHRLPFNLSQNRATTPFNLVHSDVWGPSPLVSVNGARHFLLFIDDFSRFTWIYILKSKSETFQTFFNFKAMVETQFNTKIKKIQSDLGGEYRNISSFLASHGINHCVSCPHTPQQNERVERKKLTYSWSWSFTHGTLQHSTKILA